jgi:hypothetical protein
MSPGMFEASRLSLADLCLSSTTSVRLQFDSAGTRWHLVMDAGRVVGWAGGELEAPDVELRWSAEDAARIFSGRLRGDDAIAATTVVAAQCDGVYVGPPAPLDLGQRTELERLPRVRGATLAVEFALRAGPFGGMQHVVCFEDGRFLRQRLGEHADADVRVEFDYRAMALVRRGTIGVLDALDGGSVRGSIGALAALDGIVESPEYHDAELATGGQMLALAALGELYEQPAFARAMQCVAPMRAIS